MQSRPYPEKDGLRIWLSRAEQRQLLDAVEDEPRRRIAMQLALSGLRTDELVNVEPGHVRPLTNGADGHVLYIPEGKGESRETPISEDLVERIRYLKSAARMHADDRVVDVSHRSVRNWIAEARQVLDDENADLLTMHDLRRTFATDVYYSLAFAGVPIAEELTMSWGGWAQTATGRETFRRNYLGPVPDHVTEQAIQYLPSIRES